MLLCCPNSRVYQEQDEYKILLENIEIPVQFAYPPDGFVQTLIRIGISRHTLGP